MSWSVFGKAPFLDFPAQSGTVLEKFAKCVCVCACACMYVFLPIGVCACLCVLVHIFMFMCSHENVSVSMHVCVRVFLYTCVFSRVYKVHKGSDHAQGKVQYLGDGEACSFTTYKFLGPSFFPTCHWPGD